MEQSSTDLDLAVAMHGLQTPFSLEEELSHASGPLTVQPVAGMSTLRADLDRLQSAAGDAGWARSSGDVPRRLEEKATAQSHSRQIPQTDGGQIRSAHHSEQYVDPRDLRVVQTDEAKKRALPEDFDRSTLDNSILSSRKRWQQQSFSTAQNIMSQLLRRSQLDAQDPCEPLNNIPEQLQGRNSQKGTSFGDYRLSSDLRTALEALQSRADSYICDGPARNSFHIPSVVSPFLHSPFALQEQNISSQSQNSSPEHLQGGTDQRQIGVTQRSDPRPLNAPMLEQREWSRPTRPDPLQLQSHSLATQQYDVMTLQQATHQQRRMQMSLHDHRSSPAEQQALQAQYGQLQRYVHDCHAALVKQCGAPASQISSEPRYIMQQPGLDPTIPRSLPYKTYYREPLEPGHLPSFNMAAHLWLYTEGPGGTLPVISTTTVLPTSPRTVRLSDVGPQEDPAPNQRCIIVRDVHTADLNSANAGRASLSLEWVTKEKHSTPILQYASLDPAGVCLEVKEWLIRNSRNELARDPGILRLESQNLHLIEAVDKEKPSLLVLEEAASMIVPRYKTYSHSGEFRSESPQLIPVTIMCVHIPGDLKLRWFWTPFKTSSLFTILHRRGYIALTPRAAADWEHDRKAHKRLYLVLKTLFEQAATVADHPDFLAAEALTDYCVPMENPDTALRRLEQNEKLQRGLRAASPIDGSLSIEPSDDRYLPHLHPAEGWIAMDISLMASKYMLLKRQYFKHFYKQLATTKQKIGQTRVKVRSDRAHLMWMSENWKWKETRAKRLLVGWRECGFLDEERYLAWIDNGGLFEVSKEDDEHEDENEDEEHR